MSHPLPQHVVRVVLDDTARRPDFGRYRQGRFERPGFSSDETETVLAPKTSDEFRVERSIVIDASPGTVFPLIDNFHRWTAWSPWEGVDPNLRRTYTGPDSGVGATYSWEGNRKAGKGSMSITKSVPDTQVVLDLEFQKPFSAQNVTTFLLEPNSARTTVRWQMTGRKNRMLKLFGFIVNMDKLVGKDFDKGLAQLKAEAEKR